VFLIFGILKRLLASAMSLVLLGLVGLAGYVFYNGNQIQLERTDAIVVMGASQFDGVPSPVFANRLDRAIDLHLLDVAPVIITVGGKQPGDRFTEASAGRSYLIDSGISKKVVTAIPTGDDTLSSIRAIAVYLNKNSMSSVTVVSDPSHVTRAKFILEKLGFTVYVAPTLDGPGSDFKIDYLGREVAGILQFFLMEQWGIDAAAR
jgi:uncharacterized SAM-binding protein YcdF (DUF218 family)